MKNQNENFYYDITEKDYLWKSKDMVQVIDSIRSVMQNGQGRVLEIGCGIAGIVPYLPEGVEYIGTDISEYGLERAREIYKQPNVKFKVMSADSLAFKDSYFDFVIGFNVIEHYRKPKAVLDEILRVLRPGGRLVLTGPNLDLPTSLSNGIRHRSKWYKMYTKILRLFDYIGRIFGYLRFRTIAENFTEATGRYEKPDDDLRYYCSSYEVIEYLKRGGASIVYVNSIPKSSGWRASLKKLATHLPGMKYYGRGLSVIMKK